VQDALPDRSQLSLQSVTQPRRPWHGSFDTLVSAPTQRRRASPNRCCLRHCFTAKEIETFYRCRFAGQTP